MFFNQRFLRDVFHRHQQVALFGKVELTGHGVQMQSPQYEILADAPGATRRTAPERGRRATRRGRRPSRCITAASCPIYERVGIADAKVQRTLVAQALERIGGDDRRSDPRRRAREAATAGARRRVQGRALSARRDDERRSC